MTSFLSWYIVITLLGWIAFPLAYRLFPALPDRGYTFSRALGLLIWGYVFWLFASLGIAQNDIGGLLLGLVVLVGLSAHSSVYDLAAMYELGLVVLSQLGVRMDIRAWSNLAPHAEYKVIRKSEVANWLIKNLRLFLTTEILFLAAFAFMAFARASNPETTTAGGEKWMEVAFINAIIHSPTFPPHDPWLSGYAISYYYFGYVMTAMLAEFTSVIASVAHNLMLSLIFALSAIGAFGILYNLLALRKSGIGNGESEEEITTHSQNPI